MEEFDVAVVQRYIDECLFEPNIKQPREEFDILSYSGWAAGEILNRAADEMFRPPPCVGGMPAVDLIDILEEFAFEMDGYSNLSGDERRKEMFAIARETADDILYFYMQERSNNHE